MAQKRKSSRRKRTPSNRQLTGDRLTMYRAFSMREDGRFGLSSEFAMLFNLKLRNYLTGIPRGMRPSHEEVAETCSNLSQEVEAELLADPDRLDADALGDAISGAEAHYMVTNRKSSDGDEWPFVKIEGLIPLTGLSLRERKLLVSHLPCNTDSTVSTLCVQLASVPQLNPNQENQKRIDRVTARALRLLRHRLSQALRAEGLVVQHRYPIWRQILDRFQANSA